MNIIRLRTLLVLFWVGALWTENAYAIPETFTDQASFQAAVAALPNQQTLDFEALSSGSLLSSGDSVGGITFNYAITGLTMQIRNDYDSTSASNYLGLNSNDGLFVSGDTYSMVFNHPINALGLYVISADIINDGDFKLVVNPGSAANSDTPDVTLSDGGAGYFIGILDSSQTFTSADLLSLDPDHTGLFTFNVDDISMASARSGSESVPEPSTLFLFGSGVSGFLFFRSLKKESCRESLSDLYAGTK